MATRRIRSPRIQPAVWQSCGASAKKVELDGELSSADTRRCPTGGPGLFPANWRSSAANWPQPYRLAGRKTDEMPAMIATLAFGTPCALHPVVAGTTGE